MARPPKLTSVSSRHLSKKDREKREKKEKEMQVDRSKMKAPTWLSEKAKEEFNRIVEESDRLEILDNLDIGFIAMYSESYTRAIELCTAMQSIDVLTEDKNGEKIINKTRYDLQKSLDKERNIIMQCSTKLGLSTIDRIKLVINKKDEKEENPFIKYL